MNEKLKQLDRTGFTTLKNVFDGHVCDNLVSEIQQSINYFSKRHNVTKLSYLKTVNRWPLINLINHKEYNHLVNHAKAIVEPIINEEIQAFEVDIIYKSLLAAKPTPCHQDISYAWQRPYSFSTWLPLTEINSEVSRLILLPASQVQTTEPAVDFWQPSFVDLFSQSNAWLKGAIKPDVSKGDGIVFSSKLWHGSTLHRSTIERLSLVLRWGNKKSLSAFVPKPKTTKFGLWNCGKVSNEILQKGWIRLANEKIDNQSILISSWLRFLTQGDRCPLYLNKGNAIKSLQQLDLLNQAYEKYGGGDGQGIVYPSLWKNILLPIKNHLLAN